MNAAEIKSELLAKNNELNQARKAAVEYRLGMLEGGEGYNPFDAKIETLHDQIMVLERQQKYSDDGEWKKASTITRRVSWNDWVLSFNGPVPHEALLAKIKSQGWSHTDLKAAIEHHKLS